MKQFVFKHLDITRTTTPESLKKQYKDLLNKHHSDKHGGLGDDETTKEIIQEYQNALVYLPQIQAMISLEAKAKVFTYDMIDYAASLIPKRLYSRSYRR